MDMPENPTTHKLNALLEHGGWVRALASSLVADPATADDVEQKAWLAAVEHSGPIRNPKSWLSGVVRNLTGMHWREQKARNRREDLVGTLKADKAAVEAETQQPDSISERRETFRILAVAMGNLEEPYGTALYLRFFEQLTMREIATRMKAPESTTKARITRGLEMLRKDLERDIGKEWRHCCMALTMPMAKAGAAVTTASVSAISLQAKIAAGAAIVLMPLVGMQLWGDSEQLNEQPTEPALVASMEQSSARIETTTQSPVDRINLESQPGAKAIRPTASLRIKVLEEESGAPIPGMDLQLLSGLTDNRNTVLSNQKGVTDENGVWNLTIPCGKTWVRMVMPFATDPDGFTRHEDWTIAEGETFEHAILVPRSHKLTLAVKKPDGTPNAGQSFRVSFGERDSGFRVHEKYRTNAQGEALVTYLPGAFDVSFEDVPENLYPPIAWLSLAAKHDGLVQELTFYKRRDLDFIVQDEDRQLVDEAILEFRFPTLDIEFGRVSPEGLNSWDRERGVVKTDAEGLASLELPVTDGIEVAVKHSSYLPHTSTVPPTNTAQTLVLKSGGRTSGRILDERDQPIAGAEVMAWATGELHWGNFDGSPPGKREWRRTTTDVEGNYLIHGLETEGYFFLMVQAEGFAYFGNRWKDFPSGSVDVSLKPSAPLFGYALNAQGERLSQVWVEVSGEPAFGQVPHWQTLSYYADTYRQLTDEQGAFSFPGLFSGNHKLKINNRREMRKTFHTGPSPVHLVDGDLDPGLILVDFEITDAVSHLPIPHAELLNFEERIPSGISGTGTQHANSQGHCLSRLEERDHRWFKIQAEGYIPEVLWLSDFPDGPSSRKVALTPSAPCTISLLAVDGLPLFSEDSNKSLGAALLLGNGFLMPGSYLSPFPMPAQGVGAAGHSAVRDGKTVFKNFPLAGGTLRVEVGTDQDEHGIVTHGASLDFEIPGGLNHYTLTFNLEELRALGLRD